MAPAFAARFRASPPRRSYFLNVEHVFDYYWVFRAIENGTNVNRSLFHKSPRNPHRGRPRKKCTVPTRVQRCLSLHPPDEA
jgi:hypothetical protein